MRLVKGKINRVIVARLESGEDISKAIEKLVNRESVDSGFFSAIGTLKKAKTAFYDPVTKKYIINETRDFLELCACEGNIALQDGKRVIHAHIVFANKRGEAFGGHLLNGTIVGALVEVMLTEYADFKLKREYDEKINLSPFLK